MHALLQVTDAEGQVTDAEGQVSEVQVSCVQHLVITTV